MSDIKIELPELVNKALEKPALTIGEKISDLIEIVFGGITYKKQELMYKREVNFQKFKNELTEKINKIPLEERTEPSESIIAPTLEAAKYRIDTDEIRSMFINLIVSSVDDKTSSSVHPAYIEIIKNLSADDALALQILSLGREGSIYMIVSGAENELTFPNNRQFHCVLSSFFGFEKSNIILSSLMRNGLIEIKYIFDENSNVFGSDFSKLKEEFMEYRHDTEERTKEYRYGALCLSPFGYEFAKTCAPLTYSDIGIEQYMREKQLEKIKANDNR
jgi:hypothetical protein